MDSRESVLETSVLFNDRLRMEERDVVIDLVEEKEVVKVVNSYHSIPVTSFEARKMEQVNVRNLIV